MGRSGHEETISRGRLIDRARDVTRAAGWRGLFGRGRQAYLAAVVISRTQGLRREVTFSFFRTFYASRFIGPSLPDSSGGTRRCLASLSVFAAPPIAPRDLSNRT